MIKNQASLRQLEESATSWLHKLKIDPFFRTEFILVGIFLLLSAFNILVISVSLQKFQTDIAGSVIETIRDSIQSTPPLDAAAVTARITEIIREMSVRNISMVIAVNILAALIFGYTASRIALTPTRNSLASQKQFISNVAHELRTPLSIIRANSEILLFQKVLKNDTEEMIRGNMAELDRISVIINNLLTLNTFKHSNAMNFQPVDLSEVVRHSIDTLEAFAKSKGLSLDAALENDLLVWGNKNGLTQIVMNLIKNSLLYTSQRGTIFVSTYSSKKTVTLEVRDSGIGIEPENIKKIFEPFYQVEASRSQNKGSGGLGLAIVSELVKFHRGKISIQSTPKVGTTIKIDFPAHHKKNKNNGNDGKKVPTTQDGVTLDFSK